MAAPLPLSEIVGNAIKPVVALPVASGQPSAALTSNEEKEVEYLVTLFKHYTQQELDKEKEANKKTRSVAALLISMARGQVDALKLWARRAAESGGAQRVADITKGAFQFAGQRMKEGATWTATKLKDGGNAIVSGLSSALGSAPGAAAAIFTGIWGIINSAITNLGILLRSSGARVGVIDARYGKLAPVTIPAFKLKLNANSSRYFLVDRYKEFKPADLKAALEDFSSKFKIQLTNANKNKVKSMVEKMMLDRANGRYAKSRYAGVTRELISANAWANIKSGKSSLAEELAKIKPPRLNGNRVVRLNSRYGKLANVKFPSLPGQPARPAAAGQPTGQQKSNTNIMSNADFADALTDLVQHHSLGNVRSIIQNKAASKGTINAAKAYIASLRKMSSKMNVLKNIYGVRFNNQARLEDLLRMRASRNYSTWPQEIKSKFNNTIRQKIGRRKNSISRENFDYESLASILKAINANQEGYIPGGGDYVNTLKRTINRIGTSSNRLRVNENRLARIVGAVRGVRKVTSVTNAIRNAQGRIVRLRREENSRRRERGLAPLPRNYGSYNNRGSSRIPVYPQNMRPPTYGNMRPAFGPQPNRPQPGVVTMPPALQPFPAIPSNNRGRQAPPPSMPSMRPENLLPPTEAAAVTNAGGVNKALNLVENAGGATSVAKTANILKNVGNNPNAAVAAGASPKNVKIVLQLGGANNALKVASAVPKLKKRRRSKKTKKAPKPKSPRVKEIKKLIKFLGSKNELVKKLPDPSNKEKKLTKNQVVSKITRYLLRKGK